MNAEHPAPHALKRLHRVLIIVWSAAWLAGVGGLAFFVVSESEHWHRRELVGQLELYATATYGLTWFDDQGGFHAEDFLAEPDLAAGPVDIYVVQPGEPSRVLLAPPLPRFDLPDLSAVATQVVTSSLELQREGEDAAGSAYELLAIPTYASGGDAEAVAAVIVLTDPLAVLHAHAEFVRRVGFSALAIGVLGLGVGLLLARWSVRPVERSLEQRERFLVAAAHELRTPTAAFGAVVESAQAGDESADEALRRLQPLARRTAEVVDELLLFARLDAGGASLSRESVRLDLLVEACLPETAAMTLHAEESVAHLDPRLARVAVRNVLTNAVRHAEAATEAADVHARGGVVSVTDRGPGFSPDLLALSGRSFRVAPSRGGAGLGLATAQMIAELHGGRLELANREGGGARVTLSFG